MQRRQFILDTAFVAGAACFEPMRLALRNKTNSADMFKLNYAPHIGMFTNLAGPDPVDQLIFMADQGFRAFEDNSMKARPIETQEALTEVMRERDMTMGVFVGHTIYWDKPNLTSGDKDWRLEFLEDIRSSIEVAKRVNAKWMTVVPGLVDMSLDMGYQTANVISVLREATAMLEPHNLTIVLEPLNWLTDHAGQFLTKISQAYQICKAIDSPSCKILFDVYHQQITEGNIIPNMDLAWDEIAYIQVGDNPGRNEPTTGEINYSNIFAHLYSKGYAGIVGMEHGNSKPGAEGELAIIAAYQSVDNF